MSLPSTAAKLFRLASSCATEISFQSRYPAGIFVMKSDDVSAADCADAEAINATAPPAIATPTKYEPKRFILPPGQGPNVNTYARSPGSLEDTVSTCRRRG